jgi:hypothetical protein
MKVRSKRGQVLIMVTLVLIVMCGMLGLAVDLGWSYYVQKAAKAATDAGALAAVIQAHSIIGSMQYVCGPNVTCQPDPQTCGNAIPSPPAGTNNLENGCLYAQNATFGTSGSGTWDNIMMSSDVPPATAACDGIGIWPNAPAGQTVCVHYWATARAWEGIPQLFSSVLGNTFGGSSARSTAAIVDAVVPGSLYALNRENDPGYDPPGGNKGGAKFDDGVGINIQGNYDIDAGGGVFVSSQADGGGKKEPYAIEANGGGTLTGTPINVYGSGVADPDGNYLPGDPVNNDNYSLFEDPMSGKGQPAAPTSAQAPDHAVPLGQIHGDCDNPLVMPPGSYYATEAATTAPTGEPIRVTGCVTFAAGGTTTWGDYAFFGGLHFPSGHTTVTFGPGRYFVVGAKGGVASDAAAFHMVTGVTLTDFTPLDGQGMSLPPINQGEIFVFTNHEYPGLYIPSALTSAPQILNQLEFGWVDIQTGNNADSGVNLHGLNRDFELPDGLRNFTPTVFWWDQNNSTIEYDAQGNPVYNNNDPGDPVLNTDPNIYPFFRLLAGTNTDLYGLIYMPRGSYLDLQGGDEIMSPVRIIAGSMNLGGSSTLHLSPNAPFAYVTRVTLIE